MAHARGQADQALPALRGDCPGDCLLDDFRCIHGWNGKHPRQFRWQLVLTRRWWHRVFWGPL